MQTLPRDALSLCLAYVGPGRDMLLCSFVSKRWRSLLMEESLYAASVSRVGRPINYSLFCEGRDPNVPVGYQAELQERPVTWKPLREAIKAARCLPELLRAMYAGRGTREELECALNVYERFCDAPLWHVCACEEVEDAECAEMVRALLYAGARVALAGGYGVRTMPLQEAVKLRKVRTLAVLLQAGAVVDKCAGSMKQTPLALACSIQDSFQIIKRLVFCGADICAVDHDALLPFHRAILQKNLSGLEFWAHLLRWTPEAQRKVVSPLLLTYSDANFARLPSRMEAVQLCAAVDWIAGVEFLEPLLAPADAQRVFSVLVESCTKLKGSASGLLQRLLKGDFEAPLPDIWHACCARDDVELLEVALAKGLRKEISQADLVRSVLKNFAWKVAVRLALPHAKMLELLVTEAYSFFDGKRGDWPAIQLLEHEYAKAGLPLQYDSCNAVPMVISPNHPRRRATLHPLIKLGCPVTQVPQTLISLLTQEDVYVSSALLSDVLGACASIRDGVSAWRGRHGRTILHLVALKKGWMYGTCVSFCPELEEVQDDEGLTPRALAERHVVNLEEEPEAMHWGIDDGVVFDALELEGLKPQMRGVDPSYFFSLATRDIFSSDSESD